MEIMRSKGVEESLLNPWLWYICRMLSQMWRMKTDGRHDYLIDPHTQKHAPTPAIEAHAALPLRLTNSKNNKGEDCQSWLVYPKATAWGCVWMCMSGRKGGSVDEHVFVLKQREMYSFPSAISCFPLSFSYLCIWFSLYTVHVCPPTLNMFSLPPRLSRCLLMCPPFPFSLLYIYSGLQTVCSQSQFFPRARVEMEVGYGGLVSHVEHVQCIYFKWETHILP